MFPCQKITVCFQARICLARCLYSNADLFLLDDVLSAVDPDVGDRIFEGAIMGHLKESCFSPKQFYARLELMSKTVGRS